MTKRPFGSTGIDVPIIGQGTWNMELDGTVAVKALRRGLDLGITHIDTAEMYGDGRVEEIVAEAIRCRRLQPVRRRPIPRQPDSPADR